MTQQHEKLSAFMDGELDDSGFVDSIKNDSESLAKWRSYHVIRSGLRKEASVMPEFDITAQVAAALDQEPTVLAPKSKWKSLPVVNKVVPFLRQSGQLAVAASVAAAVILGVQQVNQQPAAEEPFTTFQTPVIPGMPQTGMAPVSLEQSNIVPNNRAGDSDALLQKRRQINALLADHEQQLKLKQAEEQSQRAAESEPNQP
ncbi:transcriptional regulator [Alteromonas alba]|jgi:sigma-E factor negative regulatory protein RseA|uniref:Anti-sigma-E factor RseA n=1 Tax=Alteromonas alba TaxID=2079529 RepID=A0A2S9V7H2_9ALTE|nr:RseA family anti-sigma factor [Alteromonas alba]MCP4865181.1 transcriptional regulator [Alteromonas sp.]PRO72382.1 transcriptional regulator [Alteromonas alba]HCA77866.1 transcriptional regulator [Alteromonas sp.]HCB18747.1 transcriptional regulator [Alteromonas sp.]HCL11818.1 transcriptional regulator [Alteromonas sp.]|tara:strand:- start:4180 stop:4782 length:603 start_codon:yes stop_codon:yes gene_type:complete